MSVKNTTMKIVRSFLRLVFSTFIIRQDLRFVNRTYNLYNYTSRAVQLKQKIFHKLVDKRKGCRFIIYNIRAKIFVWGRCFNKRKNNR